MISCSPRDAARTRPRPASEISIRTGGLRAGSPPFPTPRSIRPAVRRLPRSPRFMGPGPRRDQYQNAKESRFSKRAGSFRLDPAALALVGHSGQSTARLLWARLTGRCPSCRHPEPKASVADYCAATWSNFAPPLTICRTASATGVPRETRTSTCSGLAAISSGVCFLLGMF